MQVPLLDLKAQFKQIEPVVRQAIDRVLESQTFILGPEVVALEKSIAAYTSSKHAIGVSSGSDALIVSLMALDIQPGDEVITSPYTFFATVGAISRLGAKPVFVDIDPKTYNMDPALLQAAITSKTKAVIPVHLYGQSADMKPILELCAARGIAVIEDAAQAIGTEYQGQRTGSLGLISCFSFFPSKNLGTLGDGGIMTCNDDALAEKIRVLRAHGSKPKYYHQIIGGNFRIDALHAAVVHEKLKFLDSWSDARKNNADYYDTLFSKSLAGEFCVTPYRRAGDRHIFNQYIIRTKHRDALKDFLTQKQIGNEIYYPVPMHLQECFAYLGYKKGDFPESEAAALETLAIPIYPELQREQQDYVVATISQYFGTLS